MLASTPQFLLASASPRRVAFLTQAGYRFTPLAADVPEVPAANELALQYAQRVARAKAQAIQALHPGQGVLAADTDVVLRGSILGKPQSPEHARSMLAALSGTRHQVITAVAWMQGSKTESLHSVTEIDFAPLTREQINAYVASGEAMGKAGAYAIQGGAAGFVRAVHGSYTGVVGLPVAETIALLARLGIYPDALHTAPSNG